MKKRRPIIWKIIVSALLVLVGAVMGVWWGVVKARENQALEEAKVLGAFIARHRGALEAGDPFGQYVLSRYYLNLSRLSGPMREGLFEDFGPPELKSLGGQTIDKSLPDVGEVYSLLKDGLSVEGM